MYVCLCVDTTIGFIGAPYTVSESDGQISVTVGVVSTMMNVSLVTLTVSLLSGTARGRKTLEQ